MPDSAVDKMNASALRGKALAVAGEVKKAIMGKDAVIYKVLLALFARGHVLLEDVPGVGKTTMVVALASAMNLDYRRIQFTPEVMPADVVGYSMYDKETGALSYQPGAALCNLLLVDEINRASSKTQSALLQAMEENAVTVDGVTHTITPPYTVIATQNPVGSAGTQLLPESQLDRFMVRLSLGYPSVDDEVSILKRKRDAEVLGSIRHVADTSDVLGIQRQIDGIYLNEDMYLYIARIVDATRTEPTFHTGASPRASLGLLQMSRAAAWLAGRDYVLPKDVEGIVFDVLEHRLSVGSQALVSGKTVHEIIRDIVRKAPRPRISREGIGA